MHKENALIEIRIAGLGEGKNEIDFICKATEFNDEQLTEAGFTGDIKASFLVIKSESEIAVTLKTATTAELTCDICLAPVIRELTGVYTIHYVYGAIEEYEDPDDADYHVLDRNAISLDLTEEVRETLMLSLPMKVTCTDNPDCRLFITEKEHERLDDHEKSSWHESLEKLKNKYR
ncbi:YceD family protein [Chlorobium phaeobacteroides]|jgi:uncharacterized protein|uniref:DUF177 domain-containing protein n=1 Tax=Chlorobium phaeobacteroides (strain DSM 266 / SMG 266 / 2430) TaxID=290317 RepID=A1BJ98_CHLPD|nr:DUF177 domain-containing protein [Chlorobium phaeobacteroides]ABL66475.1 protein of unknown function DUF177 [Chlorobium phaeobacteroides DSM 266]MBV5319503.1 DUF177 domain-containing protein [Chlorobium phaeobacteroides]